jgi:hypothetical protein
MISEGFKKQLIHNTYNVQLLPVMVDKVNRSTISTNKRIKNLLLFKRDNISLWVIYKYKINNIDYDIRWFLNSLIDPIYSIYKKFKIQKNISFYIKNMLEGKHKIEDNPDYVKYLEDIYD